MHIDNEGHVRITPKEFQGWLGNRRFLINNILIPGTPCAFPALDGYCRFLECLSDSLKVHPRNFLLRGSGKLGFSISPQAEKVWVQYGPGSDFDFAIVDPDYYNLIDREVRHWERDPQNVSRIIQDAEMTKHFFARRQTRRFYYYRYFDLPNVGVVSEQRRCFRARALEEFCGDTQGLDAFIFRDWWSVYGRWDYDLDDLQSRLIDGTLQQAEDVPRPYEEAIEVK
jgi:hypothetical protein